MSGAGVWTSLEVSILPSDISMVSLGPLSSLNLRFLGARDDIMGRMEGSLWSGTSEDDDDEDEGRGEEEGGAGLHMAEISMGRGEEGEGAPGEDEGRG